MPQLKLTDKSVSNLRTPTSSRRQLIYWDTVLKGLGVLCSGTSDTKTYVVKGTVQGRSVRRKVGRTNVLTLPEAKLRAKEMIHGFYAGVDPRAKKASGATLRDVMEAYVKVHDLRPRSRENYRTLIERHLSAWLDLSLRSITRDMVEARHRAIAEEVEQRHAEAAQDAARRHLARAERVERQWPDAARRHRELWAAASKRKPPSGHATANGVMRALRAVWNYAAERSSDMPANLVRLKRQWHPVQPRERHLRADDMAKFYAAVTKLASPIGRDYLLLVLFSGLRRREADSLGWSDIALQGQTLRIPAERTKGKRKLDLPLTDFVHDLLVARRAIGKTEFVFPAASKSGHLEEPRFFLDQVAASCGVRVSVHDLRRTYITVAESCDISFLALRALVNHSLGKDVTSGYVQMDVNRLREPAQKICDKLKEQCRISSASSLRERTKKRERKRKK
jgi:integrase